MISDKNMKTGSEDRNGMKQYLEEIMEQLKFPEASRDVFRKTRQKIDESAAWKKEFETVKEIFRKCPSIAIVPLLKRMEGLAEEMKIHPYTIHLLFYLEESEFLKQRYQENGVEERWFWESMKDLKIKLMECLEVYGVSGTRAGHWHSGFFVDRIALGRLQYEPRTFEGDFYKKNGYVVNRGDMVINIHIPSGESLTQEKCFESYKIAHEFFSPLFGQGKPTVFVCDSWLLDPESDTFLPPCNITRFKHNFDIINSRVDEEFHDKWRVFGKDYNKSIDELPRKTSVQRAYAEHLKQGGTVRTGYGIFLFDGEKIL